MPNPEARSPTKVAGFQVCGPSSSVFPGMLAGSLYGNQAAGTEASTIIGNADVNIMSSGLACCVTGLAPQRNLKACETTL